MKVLIVSAHPEKTSLTGSLTKVAEEAFRQQGDEVQVSDLYAQNWKSAIDRDDFPKYEPERFVVFNASKQAYETDSFTYDVAEEQKKLLWADMLVFVFPFWWFSMPAILKGWVDRVFSYGIGYGLGEYTDTHWGDRYGEGVFAGKKAMVITNAGGWKEYYSPRGVNGPIEDLLFPIHHGMLYYAGYDVLPPFVVYRSDSVDEKIFADLSEQLKKRISTIKETRPINFRPQNGGDYTIPLLQLKDGLKGVGEGFKLHVKED